MELIEIVHLRAGRENRALKKMLLSLLNETKDAQGPNQACLLSNAELDTDLSIHLHWEPDKAHRNGSETGLRLVHILKEYGFVNHNIWIKEK